MTITSNISTITVKPIPIADIYISPTGNDSNPGTLSRPLKTITKGISKADINNIILALNGTYNELVSIDKSLTVMGESRNAIIDGTNLGSKTEKVLGIVTIKANNTALKNLSIRNSNMNGIRLWSGISNIRIDNNLITKTYRSAIIAQGWTNTSLVRNLTMTKNEISWSHFECVSDPTRTCAIINQEGVSLARIDGFEFSYNYVHDMGVTLDGTKHPGNAGMYIKQGAQNGKVHHNFFARTYGKSIYLDGWCPPNNDVPKSPVCGASTNPINKNIELYKNIVRDCPEAITVTNEHGGTNENVYLHDNIVYNCGQGFLTTCGGDAGQYNGHINGLCLKNNLFYGNNVRAIRLGKCQIYGSLPSGTCNTSTPVLIKNNIMSNNGATLWVESGVPSTAYNSDWPTTNTFTLSQAQFDTKYTTLYNEIFP